MIQGWNGTGYISINNTVKGSGSFRAALNLPNGGILFGGSLILFGNVLYLNTTSQIFYRLGTGLNSTSSTVHWVNTITRNSSSGIVYFGGRFEVVKKKNTQIHKYTITHISFSFLFRLVLFQL